MPLAVRRPALALAALLALATLHGCSSSRTTAPVVPLVRRDVTVVVTDSSGIPAAGLFVRATALPDSGGFGALTTATTGEGGEARFAALAEGPWAFACTTGEDPPRAAGATTLLPGASRPEADTLVVRLTLHTASTMQAVRLPSNSADAAGTFVHVVETGALAVTDGAGSCALSSLPVGRWTLASIRYGYATHYAPFEVVTPGSALTLPAITLRWLDLPADTSTGHHS